MQVCRMGFKWGVLAAQGSQAVQTNQVLSEGTGPEADLRHGRGGPLATEENPREDKEEDHGNVP
jgi:hypothetical protein